MSTLVKLPIELPLKKKYEAASACIYCGSSEDGRTNEHIIPFALEGDLEFPAASCEACQKQTCWAENLVLQNLLLGARRALGLRSRKRKDAKKGVPPMAVWKSDSDDPPADMTAANFRWSEIPEEKRPAAVVLPDFDVPELLGGPEAEADGITMHGMLIKELRPIPPSEGPTKHGVLNQFRPDAFCRMLAKIAHGAAAAEIGLDNFEPFLPDYIRNRRTDYARVIGSTSHGGEQRDRTVYVTLHRFQNDLLAARIQLFAQFGGKPYVVVIGRLRSTT